MSSVLGVSILFGTERVLLACWRLLCGHGRGPVAAIVARLAGLAGLSQSSNTG